MHLIPPAIACDTKLLETVADIAYVAGKRDFYSGDSRSDVWRFVRWAQEFEAQFDPEKGDYIADIETWVLRKIEGLGQFRADDKAPNGWRAQFGVPGALRGRDRVSFIRMKVFEAMGSILGAGGAAWLALRIEGFHFAYVLFLLSSLILTAHCYRTKQGYFMLQQAVFTAINIGGVYCWIFAKM